MQQAAHSSQQGLLAPTTSSCSWWLVASSRAPHTGMAYFAPTASSHSCLAAHGWPVLYTSHYTSRTRTHNLHHPGGRHTTQHTSHSATLPHHACAHLTVHLLFYPLAIPPGGTQASPAALRGNAGSGPPNPHSSGRPDPAAVLSGSITEVSRHTDTREALIKHAFAEAPRVSLA